MDKKKLTAELTTLVEDKLGQITTDRLTSAVNEAWRDAFVSIPVFDNTSLQYDTTKYQYLLPDTMSVVDAIYIKRSTDASPEPISSDLWEVVDGNIIFNRQAQAVIPTGFSLILRGKLKLGDGDIVPTDNYSLQNYIVNLAAWILLGRMTFTKALSFLSNDTSMAELINFRREVERDVAKYRAQLIQSYTSF